jgi:hypothetical protein
MTTELLYQSGWILLFVFVLIGIAIKIKRMMDKAPLIQEEEELLVTEHRILLGYKIANIWVEEDEVFFIYE